MIKIQRQAEPEILERRGATWTRELCEARREYYEALVELSRGLRNDKPDYPKATKSRYAHGQIKRQLKQLFKAKCAYCESSVEAVSHLHVEHFRPQSIYPRLAYEWSNLLLACGKCNSDFKAGKFPLMDGTQPTEDRADPCSRGDEDENVLIDPCRDDPELFFSFWEATLVCLNRRAEQTREICGLNREALEDQRAMWLTVAVETAAKAYQLAVQRGNTAEEHEFAGRLKQLLRPTVQYLAMTRAKLNAMQIDLNAL